MEITETQQSVPKQNKKGHFGHRLLVTVATPGYVTMLCISSFPTRYSVFEVYQIQIFLL